ncbi:MAG: thioredoxin domain-containing protein [Gammaproteobacteria bacterium]|nr:thioredoxin domain-containing protein [Gammaproteobacteria bacterium]
MSVTRNSLSGETSPYLLQHASNPVHWYPWSDTALQLARDLDRPILLSIGYAACHWCHVMAHESFEDEATAALMNRWFINIKVAREERPDLDRIYQSAHYLLTRNAGGWPLTMFLSPVDQTPFFGGTYFPKVARYQMPAFADVLEQVAAFYAERRTDLPARSQRLRHALAALQQPEGRGEPNLDAAPLREAREIALQAFDEDHGGFGGAPKFPHAPNLERLLRDHADGAGPQCWDAVRTSLERMARGGLHDQIGGGFYRYSVDAAWRIPHFEKMLYDNGLLLAVYADALRVEPNVLFERVVRDTIGWLERELRSADGAYCSSLDADSDGDEGAYYVWRDDEIAALLSPAEAAGVRLTFGLDAPPNFEAAWHLVRHRDADEVASMLDRTVDEVERLLSSARTKLLTARGARIPPARDDKILTSWNALAIKGLVVAGLALRESQPIDLACRTLAAVRATLWRDGRLLATAKDGHARLPAYLDDYAFLLDAVLHVLQARWRDADLSFAIQLADALLEHFEDRERGGFYFVAHDHEPLLVRSKSFQDDATPAGNGIAAASLQRLGYLLGDTRYLDAAERCLRAGSSFIRHYPFGHCAMLLALDEYLAPPQLVILRGPPNLLEPWRARCAADYIPRRLCFAIPADAALPPRLAAKGASPDAVTAYVCNGLRCATPVTDLVTFESLLRAQPA